MSLLFTVMGIAVDSELSPGCDRDSGHPLLQVLLIRRAACRGSGVSVYRGCIMTCSSATELVVGAHTCHPNSPKVETKSGEFKASLSYPVSTKKEHKSCRSHTSPESPLGVLFASHSIEKQGPRVRLCRGQSSETPQESLRWPLLTPFDK